MPRNSANMHPDLVFVRRDSRRLTKRDYRVLLRAAEIATDRMAEPLTIDEYQSLLHVIPKLKRDNK